MSRLRFHHNLTVTSLLNISSKKQKKGDVGIEIECEGINLPNEIKDYWNVVNDGSLRAPDEPRGAALEYVLKTPVAHKDSRKALELLRDAMADSRLVWSYRTSVHVHINVQQLTLKQLYSFFTLYITLEDLLSEYAGGLERMGNLFCLRAYDAEGIIDTLRRAIRDDNLELFRDDNLHYAGMNVQALYKYGSVEFRAMRGNLDIDLISSWIDTLIGLRELACKYDNPTEIPVRLSELGLNGFLRSHLPEQVFNAVILYDDLHNRLYEGMRLAQNIAYGVEWRTDKPEEKPKSEKSLYSQFIEGEIGAAEFLAQN